MKFLILSNDYTGTILYERLKEEGNEPILYNPYHKDNGISSIGSLGLAINQRPDIAVACNTGFLRECKILRDLNIKIFGGTFFQDQVELNKDIMTKLCKQHKVRLLKETTNVECPLSTEVWFSNGEPIYQYLGYIKQTKFLTGDLGPEVDCESVVLWSYSNRDCEPVKRIFDKGLFEALKTIKYTGVFALDSFISSDDSFPYIFKIIPRLQSGILAAMLEIYRDDMGKLIYNILNQLQCSILLENKIACSVAISRPPYPYSYSGLIKYITASDSDWHIARGNIAAKIKELNIPQLQYRIDGCIQAQDYDRLKAQSYLN